MGETIKVSTDAFEGGFMVINKSDFDPDTMREFTPMPEPGSELVRTPVKKSAK